MPLMRTVCALVVLIAAAAAAAATPDLDRAPVKERRAATTVASVKVQKFLNVVAKATSLEEVARARRAARFTSAEAAEADRRMSKPPYSDTMRRLRTAATEASARRSAAARAQAGARKAKPAAMANARPLASSARPLQPAPPPLRGPATPKVRLLLLRLDAATTREQAVQAIEEAHLSPDETQELDGRLREPSRAGRMNWLGVVVKAGQVIAAARQARAPSNPERWPTPPAEEDDDEAAEPAEMSDRLAEEEAEDGDQEEYEEEPEIEASREAAGPDASGEPPRIVRLFPSTALEGRRVAIGGEGFGDRAGTVTVGLGGQRRSECSVVEWTPSRLVVQLPFVLGEHGAKGHASQDGSLEVRVPRGVATHPVRLLPLGGDDADRDGDGRRASEGDCDDDNGMRFAGNVEVADPFGFDEDCDASTFHGPADGDADGDGFHDMRAYNEGVGGEILAGEDCDDADPAVHPGQAESCNGIDDDCDGEVDEGCRSR